MTQCLMVDCYGRMPKKLRISVTDRCNMRCMYCMPSKNFAWFPREEVLSYEEIARLAGIFARLGVEKIRLTGGEPLVRPQLEKLVLKLQNIQGIKRLGLTTNGILLSDKISALKEAGLSSVNISLDSMVPNQFKTITGIEGLPKVVHSIRAARDAGMEVKVNMVVMRGWNDNEIPKFAQFAADEGVSVRFIEFMPLDGSHIWNQSLVVPKTEMIEQLIKSGFRLQPLNNDISEPARLYSLGGKATLGFISSISEPFCASCNRVRLTSDGKFLTCLFENPTYDVKALLRGGKSDAEIETFLIESYRKKPEGVVGIIRNRRLNPCLNVMNTIGG